MAKLRPLKSSKQKHPLSIHDGTFRKRIWEYLEKFKVKCTRPSRLHAHTPRVDLTVFTKSKTSEEGKMILNETNMHARIPGSIPWVEVEDMFEYRAELMIVGLHQHPMNGIDFVDYDIGGKLKIAICVVATEGYYDKMENPNVLWYRGEGGGDQVMELGNLAMKNSIDKKNEVRVVRGLKVKWKNRNCGKVVYFYDGLYQVTSYKTTIGEGEKQIFDFEMKRLPEQRKINWDSLKTRVYG